MNTIAHNLGAFIAGIIGLAMIFINVWLITATVLDNRKKGWDKRLNA